MAAEPFEAPPQRLDKRLVYAVIVIVVGVLSTTLAQFGVLGVIPIKNLLKNQLHADRASTAAFFFWIGIAWYFKPFAGIVTDAFPVRGTRRRSYVLIAGPLAVAGWLALYFVPHRYNSLMWVCIVTNIFIVVASTVVGAYMVEIAQEFAAPGRITSVRNFMEQFCILIGGPLGGFLGAVSFTWTAIAGGAIMFLVVPAAFLFLQERRRKIDSRAMLEQAGKQLARVASAGTMWAAAGFMAMFYCAPGIMTAVFYRQQNVLHMTTEGQGTLALLAGSFGALSAFLYGAFACKRFNLRTLLVVCLALGAASQFGYLFYSTVEQARIVECFKGFGYTLAEVAMMDLAVRATPAGSEGLGFALMMSVRNFALFGSDWVGSKAMEAFHLHFSALVVANGGFSLLAVPLVFLLPGRIVDRKDAEAASAVPVPVLAKALQD